jgi:hypothetical protein
LVERVEKELRDTDIYEIRQSDHRLARLRNQVDKDGVQGDVRESRIRDCVVEAGLLDQSYEKSRF